MAWEELQVVRSERDQATSQAKSLKQEVMSLEHKNQVCRPRYHVMWVGMPIAVKQG